LLFLGVQDAAGCGGAANDENPCLAVDEDGGDENQKSITAWLPGTTLAGVATVSHTGFSKL